MTNEEVIKKILEHKAHWERLVRERVCEEKDGAETIEAFDKAVSALEAQPCEDAISRKAVLDEMGDINMDVLTDEVKEFVRGLPSVKPKADQIPIKTRPLTEKEKAEMGTESDYMYDCPLPDDGEEVEITTHLGDVTMDIFCRESGGCYFENYCDDGDVLAWRHKPEPYKAESEERNDIRQRLRLD